MSVTKESILQAILLREFDRMQPEISTFEDDPMQFILRKYQGLNKVLTYLMTPSFEEYITGIYIVAPKPTTFKIVLHNGQFFFLQFMGKAYQATVAGKNYYLMNIGEKERCMLAIARILRFGNPLKTKGPEGAEQGTREGGEEGGGGESAGGEEVPEATPEEGGGEEETIAEARILEEVLKKKLSEEEDFDKYNLLLFSDLKKPSISGDQKKTRGDDLWDLIKTGYEFSLSDGSKKVLRFDHPYIEDLFKTKKYDKIKQKKYHFSDKKDKKYSVLDIVKTPELGGRAKGENAEIKAKTTLNDQIQEILSKNKLKSITVLISNLQYKNIIKAEKQEKVPKSDINLVDSNNKAQIFISHKDLNLEKGEKGYNDFASWGRLQTLLETEPEIKEFAKQVESKIGKNGFKPGTEYKNEGEETVTFFSKISSDLKAKIVFGKEYSKGTFNIDNVQVVIQGKIILKETKQQGVYELSGDKMWMNPQISGGEIPSKEWEPVLQAHYRSNYNNLGIKNCEAWAITANSVSANSIPIQSGKVETFSREIQKADYDKASFKDESGKVEDKIFIKKDWFDDPLNKKFRKFFTTKKEKDKTVYSIYDRSGEKYVLLLPKYQNRFKFL